MAKYWRVRKPEPKIIFNTIKNITSSEGFFVLSGLLIALSFIVVLISFMIAANGTESRCFEPPRRIERFIPTYKLGCYLFGREGYLYHWDQLDERAKNKIGNSDKFIIRL